MIFLVSGSNLNFIFWRPDNSPSCCAMRMVPPLTSLFIDPLCEVVGPFGSSVSGHFAVAICGFLLTQSVFTQLSLWAPHCPSSLEIASRWDCLLSTNLKSECFTSFWPIISFWVSFLAQVLCFYDIFLIPCNENTQELRSLHSVTAYGEVPCSSALLPAP